MNNTIEVKKINKTKNRIEYFLELKGDVRQYFNSNINMYVEYKDNIEAIPDGIAAIPLLTNILPVAWFSNSQIIIDELDKNFYQCIQDIKQGYKNMHVNATLGGEIKVNKVIDYSYTPDKKSATFFSGGVDSLATWIGRREEISTLITLWGSDIKLSDIEGWNRVKAELSRFAKRKKIENLFIKSSFREFINENKLNQDFSVSMGDGWWHGAQHGIGIIGHIAPYAFANKLKVVYMPSTFTEKDGHVSCASYPTIDNSVKFAGCGVLHEGFENTRQNKISIITDYIKYEDKDLFIRVCWKSIGGKNCSKCEKCSRTIMALISEKIDPNECGFYVNDKTLKRIRYEWENNWQLPEISIPAWEDIQLNFKKNKDVWVQFNCLNWILDIDFKKENKKKSNTLFKIKRKINNKLFRE